jgi:beta-glucanase (GH16 family)
MSHSKKAAHAAPRSLFLWRISALVAATAVASFVFVPLAQTVGAPVASAQPTCNGNPDGLSGNWTCTFDDEFNGTSLDTSLWQPQLTANSGYITGGPDCYVNNPNTISVSGGYLNLSVLQTAPFQCVPGYYPSFQAGMVTSSKLFNQTYGAFEVRAKIPYSTVPGLQETLWLYPQNLTYGPWPVSGEIDFAEFYSQYMNLDVPYIHYALSSLDKNVTAYNCTIDPNQFNTYEVDWTPTTLTMLYNGNVCLTDTWLQTPGLPGAPFNKPFFIALTQALGQGTNATTANTPLPATTQVDWVRTWTPAS